MDELVKIKSKFHEINRVYYAEIIELIEKNICIIGKNLIKKKLLKNNEMFIFINKYSKIDDSFFDENFINDITENINLNDLNKNKNLLKEYQKCNFLQKIDENKIEIFINRILNKIFTFIDYY